MLHRILDFFFPRVCPICGGRLSLGEEELCVGCLADLPRTAYIQRPKDNYLVGLFQLQVNIRNAVAFLRYLPGLPSAELVKKIKYRNGKTLAVYMGRMVAEEYMSALPTFFDDIDIIVPMPLTKKRFLHRGYNQTALIAKGISEVTNIPIEEEAVVRTSFQISQTQLSAAERRENVKDAFLCKHPDRLNGKHILLIDDVITTGSTLLTLAREIESKTTNTSFSIFALAATGDTRYVR